MPQAPAGGADLDASGRRLIVNLEADGDLYFRGISLPLENARARDSLRAELTAWGRRPGEPVVLLRVDRLRPWGEVLRLIGWVTTAPETEVAAVHFGVDIGDGPDGRLEARLRPPSLAGEGRTPVAAFDVAEAASGVAPRLRIGAGSWTFPARDPYARGPSLDAANAAWLAVRGALEELARSGPSEAISIDPRVPWAHVAQFLALANRAGVRSLAIAGDARTLGVTLSAPPGFAGPPGTGRPSLGSLEPAERDPRDASPALLVGIGVGLAAAVVFLPLVLGRRRPRP